MPTELQYRYIAYKNPPPIAPATNPSNPTQTPGPASAAGLAPLNLLTDTEAVCALAAVLLAPPLEPAESVERTEPAVTVLGGAAIPLRLATRSKGALPFES